LLLLLARFQLWSVSHFSPVLRPAAAVNQVVAAILTCSRCQAGKKFGLLAADFEEMTRTLKLCDELEQKIAERTTTCIR